MRPRVTIIVPTYKREQPLVDTLKCIAAVDYPRDALEVIVVDQTPEHEPSTLAYLKKATIRWFTADTLGFASLTKARNFGIKNATRPDIIIFVDDDVTFEASFVEAHVAAYENQNVMAVAGRIIVPTHTYPSTEPAYAGRVTWFGAFVNNYYGKTVVPTRGFVGCNFSLRASILEKAGMFDEHFIGNAMREESDMATRIIEVGGTIVYEPNAFLLHHMVESGGTRSAGRIQWYYAYFYNHFLFYRKHASAWRIPIFTLHMLRPMLACWLRYGKGSWEGITTPWRGIRDGVRAASASLKEGTAVARVPVKRVV